MFYAHSSYSCDNTSPLILFSHWMNQTVAKRKSFPLLYGSLAFTVTISLFAGWAQPVRATPMALSFDIPGDTAPSLANANSVSASNSALPTTPLSQPSTIVPSTPQSEALPIPQQASTPPTQSATHSKTQPANVYGGLDGIHLAQTPAASTPLPPPPGALPSSRILPPTAASPTTQSAPSSSKSTPTETNPSPALQFMADLPHSSQGNVAANPPSAAPPSNTTAPTPNTEATTSASTASASTNPAEDTEDLSWIFEGNSDSLVARTIGSAEGTRHANGERTQYYRGHTDPGNGVWNLGTFSYQHGANSPEEADAKQLARLQRQGKVIDQKADKAGLDLDLIETLNALDLANQSPMAALNRGGYIDRMVQAQNQGLEGSEAILWARTNSYRYPDSQRWNAPGLGNTLQGVTRDQRRRMQAIASALEHFQQEQAQADILTFDNHTPPTSPGHLAASGLNPNRKVEPAQVSEDKPASDQSLNFGLRAHPAKVGYAEAP